ncbi:hypothetical protein C8R42DRAFT_723066 [Lentinula raphanica]|nr:hypothetical protein C8R42DRAFT_723066 [Lentinula raphanica]
MNTLQFTNRSGSVHQTTPNPHLRPSALNAPSLPQLHNESLHIETPRANHYLGPSIGFPARGPVISRHSGLSTSMMSSPGPGPRAVASPVLESLPTRSAHTEHEDLGLMGAHSSPTLQRLPARPLSVDIQNIYAEREDLGPMGIRLPHQGGGQENHAGDIQDAGLRDALDASNARSHASAGREVLGHTESGGVENWSYEPLSRKRTLSAFNTDDEGMLQRFAEKVGNKGDLQREQVKRLKRHIEYSTDGNIGTVKSFMVLHGEMFQVMNKMDTQQLNVEPIMELVGVANQNAKTNVQIGETLNKTIIALSKDLVIDPLLISYTNLGHKLLNKLRTNAQEYGCKELIDKPVGESVLKTKALGQVKNSLQQFRQSLLISVFGQRSTGKTKKPKEPVPLDEFSYATIDKWRLGGLGSITGKEYQLRFAVLRVWIHDVLGNDGAPAVTDGEPNATEGSSHRGKTAANDAFWPMFTKYLETKVTQWGPDIKKSGWPVFLAECVKRDWELFGQQENRLGPLQLTSAPTTSSLGFLSSGATPRPHALAGRSQEYEDKETDDESDEDSP